MSLAGCTTSASDQSAPAVSEPGLSQPSVPGTSEEARVTDATAGQLLADDTRSVVTTGTVTVTADDPIAAASEAVRIVETAGGRVDARTENAPTENDNGSATLSLRIPSDSLGATLDGLKALGDAEHVAINAVDVTAQAQDLDARISALRASVDRLTALLATATDTKVLIDLETAISERQGNLESMEAQRRSLADQVDLSTIELSLISVTDAPLAQPDTFWDGLVAGWAAFTGFVGFLLVALGVLVPWLALAGVAALIALVVIRRRRAARAEPVDAA
ncbi:hypothetical protein GCM10027413_28810 [Conyzicola nivalis]|uniref:DUF4349 domain-containing protein n=1 Tax=Conyzicola nivalis TaxID=1477021 RepID=A0A916SRZ9_9MICO|nr:hypothetical protein GCM10010979_30700 [Conyzicola nivalis]